MLSYVVFIIVINLIAAIPKPDDIVDKSMQYDPLHDGHFDNGHHNVQYDHEQFLGEESRNFDQFSPDESKRRLGLIVDRIDEDKDGFVTEYELKQWIKYTKRRYIDEDVTNQWKLHSTDGNATIPWEVYRNNTYGFMDSLSIAEKEHEENGISYNSMLNRDRRRWGHADQDLDDALNREEFTAFLHPEEHPVMRDVVLDETIEDIDKNKDGKISVDEYIGDMYRATEPDEQEPEWVTSERETFTKFRDMNSDGYLDREEVRAWIVPKDFDHAESEAMHLIFEADTDADNRLTKSEILDKYDVFVGSQATEFGEALARHDEF